MRRPTIFIPIIILCIFLSNTIAARGYRVKIAAEKGDTTHYALYGWKWGERRYIDTTQAARGGILFKGKEDLLAGSYVVEELSGRKKIAEFIVPRENRNFSISYGVAEKGYKIKSGNRENRLFTEFLNYLNYNWKEVSSAEEFAIKINEFKERAATDFPGSISDIIFKNTLYNPKSEDEIIDNFPFADPIIVNTQFAEDKVTQYLGFLQYNHNDTIIARANRLIGQAGSTELKSLLAYTIYDYFYNSPIMGQEGVAVAIAQEWFLSDKLVWPNEEGKFLLKTFVEFNRHSLIGMDAPELVMSDTLGQKVSLREQDGEYTIVYFYTDDCASCKSETPKLVDFVNEYQDGVLSVYAVYADSNEQRWKNYINSQMYIYNPFMNWVNVYDPEYDSGFQMLYNVIKTPQMFLLDKDKKIIGRGLNVDALKELLQQKNKERDDLRKFIEDFFTPLSPDTTALKGGIDLFYQNCKNNTELFKEIFREAFETLGRSGNYNLQQGAVYIAQRYILGMPEHWSESLLQRAQKAVTSFNMNKLGELAADIELERADKSSIYLFDIPQKYKVLYFYRPNCGMCSIVTPKLEEMYNTYKDSLDIEFIAVNLGSSYPEWIDYISQSSAGWEWVMGAGGSAKGIYEKYYLENIPAIYLLQENRVVAKDINELDLKEILESISYDNR